MTQEAPITFFTKQRRIYPRRVWGRYRKLKWVSMVTLLAIYYLTPWLRWDRGPHAPDQAILIDMPGRRGYFFGLEIWPQEVYYLAGILILAAVGLFFVTSLFGRVWCGYACPQTVWTDLFVWVERIVQGDRNARMKLDQSPLTFEKLWKKGLTHAVWLAIGLVTGGAWVFYFNDAPTLFDQIRHFDVPWSVGGWIVALTGSTYLMAGYAREQVCTYMCPYARFQSAMFDKDTLIISYDKDRGEPRSHHKAGESWEGRGHCIDCNSCVVVCPMGIDIRNGLQMECIACGLCVDACNNVMDKVGLPQGLIRYDTEKNYEARLSAPPPLGGGRLKLIRPRTVYYTVILAAVGGLMLLGLLTRTSLELSVMHDRNPLFVQLSDGHIRNTYTIKILNKTHDDRIYALSVQGLPDAALRIEAAGAVEPEHIPVFADNVGEFRVMISALPDPAAPRRDLDFIVQDIQSHEAYTHRSIFVSGN
ncbi:MAG: cytochrome c oxidase accessory protein CcoG [Pseudomonadota bacterium]|nr:cytochrome c oxidase accessory protein CcoG [Pseudomonadota bacterium]